MRDEENTLLTFKDTMDYLRVSRATLYRLIEAELLPGYKVGGAYRFWLKDVKACVRKAPTLQETQQLSWAEKRMARYVKVLVEQEQPASDEDRRCLHDEWYEQGEQAIIDAMRYYRRKRKSGKAS